MYRLTLSLLLALVPSIAAFADPGSERVSMIRLIANPEKFQGKQITLEGWMNYQFENNTLHLANSDPQFQTVENTLWLKFDSKALLQDTYPPATKNLEDYLTGLDGAFVKVTGTFDQNCKGHMGMFPGCLVSIKQVWGRPKWMDERIPNWKSSPATPPIKLTN